MEQFVEVPGAIDDGVVQRIVFAVHAVEERRDGIGCHFGEYEPGGACAVTLVRFEHGRFIAVFFMEFLELVEGVNDGDVFFAELLDPFFVLREVDAFFSLVGIIFGNDL